MAESMVGRYKRHPQSAGRVIEGTAFVVTAEDNVLHTLNDTGTALWDLAMSECCAGAGFTAPDAAAVLVREFEVEQEEALADTEECLRIFVEKGLLVAADE